MRAYPCPLDHVLGAGWVYDTWGLKPRCIPGSGDVRTSATVSGGVWRPHGSVAATGCRFEEDEPIRWAAELEVRFTPGHAPGHVVLVHAPGQWVIGGDVLFQGSIGRTDLPGSHAPDLVTSIEEQLFALPDGFEVGRGTGRRPRLGRKGGESLCECRRHGMLQAEFRSEALAQVGRVKLGCSAFQPRHRG